MSPAKQVKTRSEATLEPIKNIDEKFRIEYLKHESHKLMLKVHKDERTYKRIDSLSVFLILNF